MRHRSLAAWTAVAALLLSLASALSPAVSQASPPALPTRPEEVKGGSGGDSGSDSKSGSDEPAGAWIELHAPRALAGGWAVVQWQDHAGNWHDVEGWQGRLDGGGASWWVHPKDFGSGPFRWTVSEQAGGKLLGASQPFSLPGEGNQVLQVAMVQ